MTDDHMRRCSRCCLLRPLGQFGRGRGQCNECRSEVESLRRLAALHPNGQQLTLALDWSAQQRRRSIERATRWNNAHPEVRRELVRKRRERLGNKGRLRTVTRRQLRARWDYYGGRCWICGAQATQTDHVKPVSRGGVDLPCNLRPICQPCNVTKSNAWPFLTTSLPASIPADRARRALTLVNTGDLHLGQMLVDLRRAS